MCVNFENKGEWSRAFVVPRECSLHAVCAIKGSPRSGGLSGKMGMLWAKLWKMFGREGEDDDEVYQNK